MSLCPIAALNPFSANWMICGKVIAKSEVKNWSNANGKGCFFNFLISDSTGSIKAIAFNDQCERFFSSISLNNVYFVMKGTVKDTKKQFMQLNNAYEIHLSSNSHITLAKDVSVQEPECKFIKIAELANASVDELINIKCIVKRVDDLEEYGTDKVNYKRNIGLVDDSKSEIELTLWNEKAKTFDCKEGSVMVGKRLKVSNYKVKNLLAIDVSHIAIDPEIPEVAILKEWYFKNGSELAINHLTLEPQKFDLQTIKRINNSMNVHCDATLVAIAACHFYASCPDGCNKKLNDDPSGFLYCNDCKKVMMEGNQKLILKVKIVDFTAAIYLTIYTEVIEKLLDCKCDQLSLLSMENRDELENKLNQTLLFNTYAFDIKIKMITRDGSLQPDYSAIRINRKTASCEQLIHEINSLAMELENMR